MNLGILVVLLAMLAMGMAYYSQASLRNKIFCTFRRPNKTKIEKFVSLRSKFVIFDGGKYIVNPKRVTLMWYNRGINAFFPTWVPSLDYRWDTDQPLDPETFEATWETPEARQSMGQEENIKALDRAVAAQTGKKQSRFQEYLPWITLGALIVVVYLVYQMSQNIAVLEQLIKVK